MTLPPMVPLARVACDPTMAEASARPVNRSRITACDSISSCVTRAPRRRPAAGGGDAAQRVDAVDGHEGVGQGLLALAGADHEVGAPGDGASPAAERLDRLLDARRGDVGTAHAPASSAVDQTRSGVIGRWLTCLPMTRAIAFAMAPDVGTLGGSPTPFEPFGPAFGVSTSIQWIVDLRAVRDGHQLVVEQVRVALAAVGVDLGALGECLAEAHHDPAVHLAVGADLVDDLARVVRRGEPQHAHDAGLAVDLHVRRVRDQLRREEGRQAEIADAVRRDVGRAGLGHVARALAEVAACRSRPGRRSATDRSGEPLTRMTPSATSRSAGAASSWSAASVEQLLAHLGGGTDHGAAVVERRLRPGRAHVPRARVGVLVEDREVLRLHAEHLGGEDRQAHDGARARTPSHR